MWHGLASILADCGTGFSCHLAGVAETLNSHIGLELGRQDDLEFLAYVLFYFLWGSLPWQGLKKRGAILERKRTIMTHHLFLDLPVEFCTFFEHCRSLSFNGKPNYDHFYNLFSNLMLQERFQLTQCSIGILLAARTDGIVQIRVVPFSMNAIILPGALHGKYPTYLVLIINLF